MNKFILLLTLFFVFPSSYALDIGESPIGNGVVIGTTGPLELSDLVPYIGATKAVNLGTHNLTTSGSICDKNGCIGTASATNVTDIWVDEAGDTMTGNLAFDTGARLIAGIENQNLVDKTADEIITGNWEFTENVTAVYFHGNGSNLTDIQGLFPYNNETMTFRDVYVNDSFFADIYYTRGPGSPIYYNFYDSSENLILNATGVQGNKYFSIETDGAFFQLYSNPNPSIDYLLATITETQGANTEINFYEGGTTHNRFYDSGSARFGGDPNYLCTQLTDMVDCDTSSTGADVLIQDDIWMGGKGIFGNGSLNISDEGDLNITNDFFIWNPFEKLFKLNNSHMVVEQNSTLGGMNVSSNSTSRWIETGEKNFCIGNCTW